jgi:hypothetical protein
MKKMKKVKKIALSVGLALASSNIFVGAANAKSFTEIISESSQFVSPSGTPPITVESAATDLQPLTNILFTIATTVLVIVGLVLGIKYMMSEPNDKSKIKEKVIWYCIAIILVYAGVEIAQLVANFITNNFAG